MTNVGHTTMGAAIGALCKPEGYSTHRSVAHYAAFMMLANAPDLGFENWGHDQYRVSHSILVNLALIATVVALLARVKDLRARVGGWPVVIGGAAAWLSHFLLDALYAHGRGVALLWPLSDARLALPVPWFASVHFEERYTGRAFRAYAIELASYGPLLMLALGFRKHRGFPCVVSGWHSIRARRMSEKGTGDEKRACDE
jgi:membrane-bound metal-dependent hydrolase YbcI (DUF457 family)